MNYTPTTYAAEVAAEYAERNGIDLDELREFVRTHPDKRGCMEYFARENAEARAWAQLVADERRGRK